jgi:hypothetical protein
MNKMMRGKRRRKKKKKMMRGKAMTRVVTRKWTSRMKKGKGMKRGRGRGRRHPPLPCQQQRQPNLLQSQQFSSQKPLKLAQ